MKNIVRSAVVALSLMVVSGAQSAEFGYEFITPAQNTNVAEGKVEVLEFFWYGCPHCEKLEPVVEEWKKNAMPDYVEFKQVAAPLNPNWTTHSKAFYAAETMGVLDKFHEPLFHALHDEGKRISTPEALADFAAEQGIDRDTFLKTMNSFAVQTKVMRAMQIAKAAGLTGVPAVTVNGKYKTGVGLAGGRQELMKLINELAAEEKQ